MIKYSLTLEQQQLNQQQPSSQPVTDHFGIVFGGSPNTPKNNENVKETEDTGWNQVRKRTSSRSEKLKQTQTRSNVDELYKQTMNRSKQLDEQLKINTSYNKFKGMVNL